MPSKKHEECSDCGSSNSILRAYIRINENRMNVKRKWQTIGWYCTECFHFYNDWSQ